MNNKEIGGFKGEIRKYLNLLKGELKELSNSKVSEINSEISEISNYHSHLFEGNESIKEKINTLITKLEEYDEKFDEINDYHTTIFEGDEETYSLKEEIEGIINEIKNYKVELLDGTEGNASIKGKINTSYVKIKEYYDSIFGIPDEIDETGGVVKKGQKGYKEKLEKLYVDKTREYTELKRHIESLLPGATSAGLSSSYKEMKDSFKYPNIFWSIAFFLSLGFAIYLGRDIKVGENLEKTILNIISHLPFILPLIWLGYFSSKQQSQNKRLQQEYAHKESLAKSFEGYKNQIDNLGDDEKSIEIKKMLMENIVKMTGENPSSTLDKNHGTNPPIWEYFFGSKSKDN